jgi:hypothetical protein
MKQEIVNQLRDERAGYAPDDTITKYWALRIIANINRVIGAILIIFGGIGLSAAVHTSDSSGIAGALGLAWSLALGLAGTAWFAGAELIYVLIDIESNTRQRFPSVLATTPAIINKFCGRCGMPLIEGKCTGTACA